MTPVFIPNVPGSRSVAARALVCAALASGDSELTNLPSCDDTSAIMGCLRMAAVEVRTSGSDAHVGGAGVFTPSPDVLDCNASGTTLRFIAALSILTEQPVTLTGTPRLMQRPMQGLDDALTSYGKQVERSSDHITVTGIPEIPDHSVVAAGESGQFVSGLIMALACTGKPTTLRAQRPASKPFIAMTVKVMRSFGADVQMHEHGHDVVFTIGGSGYAPQAFKVETDVMSANYFLAAAAITGWPVFVKDLSAQTVQGDVALLSVIENMGGTIQWHADGVRSSRLLTSPLAGVTVDLSDMPDMSLTIAAMAAVATGPTVLTAARILRFKESDRLYALTTELSKLGVATHIYDDGDTVAITPNGQLQAAVIQTYHDHRMAMAFGLLTLIEPAITISDPGCVSKTWPEFFAEIDRYKRENGAATSPM